MHRRPRISLEKGDKKNVSAKKLALRTLHLFISEMHADLSPIDSYQSLNPFIMFMTNPMNVLVLKRKGWRKKIFGETLPAELLSVTDEINEKLLRKQNKMWPHTSRQSTTLNPSWNDTEVHLEFNQDVNSAEHLTGAFLYITIFHSDPAADILVGTVVVNLQRIASSALSLRGDAKSFNANGPDDNNDDGAMHVVDLENEPILKNGRIRGYLSCQLVGWWLENNENPANLSARHLGDGRKMKAKRKGCSIM